MTSKPNIGTFEIVRLRIDGNDPVKFIFTRNNTPIDVSSREFLFRFSAPNTSSSLKDITNDMLDDETNGFSFNPFDFATSLTQETYSCWLFEVIPGAKLDVIAFGSFTWKVIPETAVAGQPRKPADIQINEVTATGATTIVEVYTIPGAGGSNFLKPYSSKDAVIAAPMPEGATAESWVTCVVPSNVPGQSEFYFKRGLEVIGIVTAEV